jgi:hypothetical protein
MASRSLELNALTRRAMTVASRECAKAGRELLLSPDLVSRRNVDTSRHPASFSARVVGIYEGNTTIKNPIEMTLGRKHCSQCVASLHDPPIENSLDYKSHCIGRSGRESFNYANH